MRKGSAEAKAWGRKMKRLRSKGTTKRRKTRVVYVTKKRKRRASSMVKRRKTRRRKTSPLNKLTRKKTLLWIGAASLLGASVLPQVDSKYLAAAAGYMSGAGIVGAAGGFFAQPYITNMLGGVMGGTGIATSGIRYN